MMENSNQCFSTLLHKVLIWSARSLAVIAVTLLGKSDETNATVNLAGMDGSYSQEKINGSDQVSYVEVGEVDEDGGDWPPPFPT